MVAYFFADLEHTAGAHRLDKAARVCGVLLQLECLHSQLLRDEKCQQVKDRHRILVFVNAAPIGLKLLTQLTAMTSLTTALQDGVDQELTIYNKVMQALPWQRGVAGHCSINANEATSKAMNSGAIRRPPK